jgi:surface antigen
MTLSMEQNMIKKIAMSAAAAALMLGLGATGALADDCSGRDHNTGTALGAVGGGLLGGLATHSVVGGLGGALLGGLAGNAISRDMDCDDQREASRSYDDSFRGPVGQRHEWNAPGHDRGYIITDREYRGRRGRLCRDFTQVTYRHGREMDQHGTACRGRDGNWEFM